MRFAISDKKRHCFTLFCFSGTDKSNSRVSTTIQRVMLMSIKAGTATLA